MAVWNDETEGPLNPLRKPREEKRVPEENRRRAASDDWRAGLGGGQPSPASSAADDSEWTSGPYVSRETGRRTPWRVLVVGSAVGLAGLIAWFFWMVFQQHERIPVVHVVLQEYQDPLVGHNPFGDTERQIWGVDGPDTRFRKGLRIVLPSDPAATSRLLQEVSANEDGLRRWVRSRADGVRAGGPSKSRIWLISGIARVDPGGADGPRLRMLLPRGGGDPRGVSDGLEIGELIRQISGLTADDELEVILFDLRSPPVVSAMERSSVPWESLVRQAYEAALPERSGSRERIIVGIAAGDHESNRMAPELSSGVFTHFVYRALGGEADGDASGGVSWGELRSYVTAEVRRWSRLRRDTSQTPRWLIPESLETSRDLLSVDDGEAESTKGLPESRYREKIAELRELWQKHDLHRDGEAHIRQPLVWGRIEADLLLMQAMATDPNGAQWTALKARIESGFRSLVKSDPGPVTSIYEMPIADDFYASTTQRVEAFWERRSKEEENGSPALSERVNGIELLAYQWSQLIGRIDRKPVTADRNVYRTRTRIEPSDLRERLAQIGRLSGEGAISNPSGGVPQQELQLLRLMLSEIDWEGIAGGDQEDDYRVACLDLCRCFDLIMETAGQSLPTGYPWIEEELEGLEAEFAVALDELFSGQPGRARGRSEGSDTRPGLLSRLQDLAAESSHLRGILRLHAESHYRMGHWLAWLDRGHHAAFLAADSEEQSEFQAGLREWADLLRSSVAMSRLRAESGGTAGRGRMLDAGRELEGSYAALDERWTRFVDDVRRSAGSASNFRRLELAQRSPLTDASWREALDQRWLEYLRDGRAGSVAGGGQGLPSGDAIELPPSAVEIVRGRLREFDADRQAEIQELLRAYATGIAFEVNSDALLGGRGGEKSQGWSRLTDWRVRHAAVWLGHHLTREQRQTVSERIRTRRQIADARQWRAQGLRVCRFGWGDGREWGPGRQPLATVSTDLPFFFRQASVYAEEIETLGGSDLSAEYARPLADRRDALLERVRSLRLSWGDPDNRFFETDEARRVESVVLAPSPAVDEWTPLIGTIYVTQGNDLSANRLSLPGGNRLLAWPLDPQTDSSSASREIEITMDWFRDGSGPVQGGVAFRGHHQRVPLEYQPLDELAKWTVRFKSPPRGPASLVVDAAPNPPVLDLMLLIDCSGSMDGMMDGVKEQAVILLDTLGDLDLERTVKANVGVMLFGVRGKDEWHQKILRDYSRQPGGQRLGLREHPTVPEIWQTRLGAIGEDNWGSDLRAFILSDDFVKRSGDTPMYAAIDQASSELNATGRNSLQQIVVIGDGKNDTQHALTFGRLVQNLKRRGFSGTTQSTQSRKLNILLFDSGGSGQTDELRNDLKRELGDRYDYFETRNLQEFHRRIRRLVPPTEVRLGAASDSGLAESKKLGESFEFAPDDWGGKVHVVVDQFVGEARTPGPVPVYPNQTVRLTLGGRDARQIRWRDWSPLLGRHPVWGDQVFQTAEPARDTSARRLTFRLDVDPETAGTFPERPREFLAEVRQVGRGGRTRGAFRVWDACFENRPGKPFPQLRLAELPWFEPTFTGASQANELAALSAEVRLWLKSSPLVPEADRSIVLEPGQSVRRSLGEAEFELDRDQDRVTVVVRASAGRDEGGETAVRGVGGSFDWIVRVAESHGLEAERSFTEDGSRAEHTFWLPPERSGETVAIEVFRFDQAVRQMDRLLEFDPFPTNPSY